jgi:hypothetical protein
VTAPRRPTEQATIRGAIVVFIAVLIGVALLSRSDGGIFGSSEAGGAGPTTSTTSTASTTTTPKSTVPKPGGSTPTAQAHKPAEVKVIVVNAAGGIPGIGSENTSKVEQAGFAVLPVKNADQDVDTTGLFYAAGYQADAAAVKAALGFGDVPVQAAGDPIIPEAAEAHVVVVLGKDYASVATG